MADRGLIYPNLPGNCPDAGYKLVSKNGFVEPPLSSENLEWTKDTAITEADKQQIITNKNNITQLQADVASIETEVEDAVTDAQLDEAIDALKDNLELQIEEKSEVSGVNDGTNWTKITIDGVEKNIPSGGGTPVDAYTKAETDALLDEKADSDDVYTKTEVDTLLDDKVDKETGKGLSTNDFTTADKNKVALIDSTETLVFTLSDDTTVNVKVVTGV